LVRYLAKYHIIGNKARMINDSDCQDIYFLPKLILK